MALISTAPLTATRRRVGVRLIRDGWAWSLLVILLAALVLLPLLQLMVRAFDGADPIRHALELPGIGQTIANTFSLAAGATVLATVLGTALAVCAVRLPARGSSILALAPVVPLIVPHVASVTGWVFLLSPRPGFINQFLRSIGIGSGASGPIDIFTLPGITMLVGLYLTSFVYLYVYASLRQRGTELETAAIASGASPWQAFRTITLPLLRPSMAYAAGIAFLLGLGQFTAPLFLGSRREFRVLTTQMFRISQDYPIDYGAGAALALPLVAAGFAVVLLQRIVIGDERRFVSMSGKGRHVAAGRSWLPAVPLVLYAFIAVVLPISALVVTALSPYWSGSIEPSTFNLDGFREMIHDEKVTRAVGTTLKCTAISLAFLLPIGFLSAIALARRAVVPRVLRVAIDLLSSLSLSMPAALFGFALLNLYAGPPMNLYGTTTVIIIAYVTLMIPHGLRPQLSAVLALGQEYSEASRVSGANPIRTVRYVIAPLVRGGIGVSAAVVVILLFHEFAASVMVRSATTQVVGTLLFDQWTGGTYRDVAVIALVTTAVTLVGVVAAVLIGGFKSLESM